MEIPSLGVSVTETIMIVDDEAAPRQTLVQILQSKGRTCVTASNANEALELLANTCIDLVITDMKMPEVSGLDLIDKVRQFDDSIPVILATGYPSIHVVIDAMKRGAIDVFTKPFEIERLTQMVSKALQERRLRQENQRLQAEVNKAAVIEKLNRELNARLEELTRLYGISEAMSQVLDTDGIFSQIVHVASATTGAQRVSLMMFDRVRRHLNIRASVGVPAAVIHDAKADLGCGIAGKVALSGKPIRKTQQIDQASGDPNDPKSLYMTRSWLSMPLFVGQEVFGVLNLTDKIDQSDFALHDEQAMQALLEKAGSKLENQALYEGIYANLVDTLNALITTIEAKDPYTHEHSERVTQYALEIAKDLDVDDEKMEMIEFAGVLHDIGKIGVRDGILTKCGKLTADEYDAIKQHPIIGEKIVSSLGLNELELSIIRNHHERFDGKGYPDGLAGEDIPYLARIVSVADAFDAMTTTRSYRQALSVDQAVEELKRNSGSQFDPAIVPSALRAIEDGKISVQPQSASPDSQPDAT